MKRTLIVTPALRLCILQYACGQESSTVLLILLPLSFSSRFSFSFHSSYSFLLRPLCLLRSSSFLVLLLLLLFPLLLPLFILLLLLLLLLLFFYFSFLYISFSTTSSSFTTCSSSFCSARRKCSGNRKNIWLTKIFSYSREPESNQ